MLAQTRSGALARARRAWNEVRNWAQRQAAPRRLDVQRLATQHRAACAAGFRRASRERRTTTRLAASPALLPAAADTNNRAGLAAADTPSEGERQCA